MTGRILYGRTPLDLIREYTAYTGRMPPMPDWVGRGAIVSVQGGTDEANKKLDTLERAGIPLAGLWIQDWPGVRITNAGKQLWWNWELDESYYPRWDALVDRLARLGARMLVYINPFLSTEAGHDSLYQQARQAGYLVKRQDGTPYLIRNTDFDAALVDLSNPEAGVLRNHEGLNPAISWQVDSDAETLAHFARMSKIFRALGFYRQGLMRQAADSGAPLVRHPFLEFPQDPNTHALRYQYLLGSDFMVAQVVTRGAQSVRLYLPAGTWTNLWTGQPFDAGAGAWTETAAPFGKPAVLYKAGSAAANASLRP